jgi:integrase
VACIYPRKRSPFWHMEWRDPATGLLLNRSTKLRRDSTDQTRRARQLCAQRTANELEAPIVGHESWKWVHRFLATTYGNSPKTLSRYRQAWFAFSMFLRDQQVSIPRQLQREQAEAYIIWRLNPPNDKCGVRAGCRNTALLDLKVVSRIMREAVLRKLAPANPFLQLGFKRDQVKSRPDILPHEMEIIQCALEQVTDETMRISWAIAMKHGRRLSETSLPMEDVDLIAGTITFRNKGGELRTKLLHPELVPLMKRLKEESRARTFDLPPNFSKKWSKFFDDIGLPHITFHSTRVRVATKLMEEGVHPEIARDYIDHSSALIHRIYLRQRPAHHQAAVDALGSKKSTEI